MKNIFILIFVSLSLHAVSYSTLYDSRGKGYEGSTVYIDGKFTFYRCSVKRGLSNHSKNYCKVFLDAYDSGNRIGSVAIFLGTTWESDFKSAKRGDTYSFSCTYRNNLSTFKDCN